MPTPVSVARQCLTPEAAHALDEAVAVARRRGHAQTTSLHAVSALLSLPSSTLREACARARNSAYSPRLQFKALDLCLSVSLDRVASTQLADNPPVSNSLMAAIKRSQANQRRQPENFHLHHQIPNQSSISCVKVELQHLILSILDDPVVSRVFGEAGFRSSEIKLAIVRPLPQLLRYSRSRGPPLFLCNLTEYSEPYPGPDLRGFAFPFSGFPGFCDGDENCRRIGEVMSRNKGKNPLLVGVCAYSALQSFTEAIEKRKDSVLPVELSGLNVICIENDVSEFVTENTDKGTLSTRFGEVASLVQQSLGPGLVVNFGDLKAFVSDEAAGEAVSHVVYQLTRLLKLHAGKVWLIGAAASYESYLKFVNKFPSVEKDWDVQLLPITSLRPPSMAESYPRSSLMESFVPFGGFFSTPSDLKVPFSSSYQCIPRCRQCNEKCEQEVIDVSKDGFTTSIAGQSKSTLPSWLQMTEISTNKCLDMKTKDGGVVLSAKVAGVQKKWDNICRHLHQTERFPETNTFLGFRFVEEKKENTGNHSSNHTDASSSETNCVNADSSMSMDVQKMAKLQSGDPFRAVSKAKNESLLSKQLEQPSKAEDPESGGLNSPPCSLSNSSVGEGVRTSPTSATSVTTDLGLGICSSPSIDKPKKCINEKHAELPLEFSGCFSADVHLSKGNISNHLTQSLSCSSPDFGGQFDPKDLKTLFRALTQRVGWQDEAISVMSQRIVLSQTSCEKRHGAANLRADIWFNFVGPDRFGKKKIALALAEILYGSWENFICMDLSHDVVIHSKSIFNSQEMNGYEVKFRGKTLVDYLADQLSKKPLSVVFLENVDKADLQAQTILSQAIRTGKLSDSHGRETSISNAMFLTTSTTFSDGKKFQSFGKESSNYSEERILQAKCRPMQIRIGNAFWDNTSASGTMRKDISSKRKLICSNESLGQLDISEIAKRAHMTSTRHLDLNLPAEDNEAHNTDDGNSDLNSISENSSAWLKEFSSQVDETIVFKPFDFDALARKFSKEIKKSFHEIVGSDHSLEIDPKVMDQLLAAAYTSERNRVVEDWVERVLSRAFVEVPNRYSLTPHSTVKLATCEGSCSEELAPGVYLPPRIILS